jgi:predicted 3-demethylubiquinone-9 3-methyltransferase (glyoxalase superfamily)
MATRIRTQRISPMLWFEDRAEEAAAFYTSIFKNSRILATTRYGPEGEKVVGRPPGSVMTVAFVLDGQEFTALNGGPHFQFNEAISLVVRCGDQEEVDYYWDRLSEGGDPRAQQCGWLKDKFGVSWQVVPDALPQLLAAADPEKASRIMAAVLDMKKLDVGRIRRAAVASRATTDTSSDSR